MKNIEDELKKEDFDISLFENDVDVLQKLINEYNKLKMDAIHRESFEMSAFWRDRERKAIYFLEHISNT